MIIRIPYEWVVFIFGDRLAPYFNDICNALCIIGFFFYLLKPKKTRRIIKKKVDTRPIYIDQDVDGKYVYTGVEETKNNEPIKEEFFGQYDRYSHLTDEEMRLAMQIRVERKGPTYEEWKAAKEKEMKAESIEVPEEKKIQKVKPKIKHQGK